MINFELNGMLESKLRTAKEPAGGIERGPGGSLGSWDILKIGIWKTDILEAFYDL